MFGHNKQFKKNFNNFPNLAVNSVFQTIQGEGPFAGRSATFLRMAQCNLACTFCDTEFEKSQEFTPEELVKHITELRLRSPTSNTLLVLTGGEPLLQDFTPFLALYFKAFPSHHVQIETAGTVWQDALTDYVLTGKVSLVCSPKTTTINQYVAKYCTVYKYILSKDNVDWGDGLPDIPTQPGLKKRAKLARPLRDSDVVYVQAMDAQDPEKNLENLKFAAEIAMFWDYRLSVQIHKILGLE